MRLQHHGSDKPLKIRGNFLDATDYLIALFGTTASPGNDRETDGDKTEVRSKS